MAAVCCKPIASATGVPSIKTSAPPICFSMCFGENAHHSVVLKDYCKTYPLFCLQVLSRANSALSEKVILQEKQHRDRQTELLDMKYTLTEMASEDGQNLSSETLRGLEEKVQELSVQVCLVVFSVFLFLTACFVLILKLLLVPFVYAYLILTEKNSRKCFLKKKKYYQYFYFVGAGG